MRRALEIWGGKPVSLDGSQVYEGLQRGTIDGAFGSLDTVIDSKYYEVAPYVVDIKVASGYSALGINLKLYNGLSPELKKAIDASIVQAEAGHVVRSRATTQAAIKKLQDTPKTFYSVLPDAEVTRLKSVLDPYWAELKTKWGDEWTRFEKVRDTVR